MNKNWLFIATLFISISTSNSIQAQELNDGDLVAMVDFNDFEEHNTKYISKSKSNISKEERIAKAKAYDLYVSKEFGSYLNPYNGALNIVNQNSTHFTKAQFLNKSTNEKVFTITIDYEIKTMNISNYSAGEYILILSNNNGDILVENFIII